MLFPVQSTSSSHIKLYKWRLTNLKLAPQPTLFTTNTVHDTGDIPKVKLELFLREKKNKIGQLSIRYNLHRSHCLSILQKCTSSAWLFCSPLKDHQATHEGRFNFKICHTGACTHLRLSEKRSISPYWFHVMSDGHTVHIALLSKEQEWWVIYARYFQSCCCAHQRAGSLSCGEYLTFKIFALPGSLNISFSSNVLGQVLWGVTRQRVLWM